MPFRVYLVSLFFPRTRRRSPFFNSFCQNHGFFVSLFRLCSECIFVFPPRSNPSLPFRHLSHPCNILRPCLVDFFLSSLAYLRRQERVSRLAFLSQNRNCCKFALFPSFTCCTFLFACLLSVLFSDPLTKRIISFYTICFSFFALHTPFFSLVGLLPRSVARVSCAVLHSKNFEPF